MHQKIVVAENTEAAERQAVDLISERARVAITARGRFTLALSGGSSVRSVYARLAAEPGIDWTKVFLFLVDERFVEPTNPYSNFALVKESLIDRLPSLPASNVFSVPTDAPTPDEGARQYEAAIRRFFALEEGEWPRFDLCINGMGPDGHTASLFPHSPALSVIDRIAVMNHAGLSPWVDRVTLTFPALNHARCVLFLAGGAKKAEMLKAILEGERDVSRRPSQGVQPTDGELIWLLEPEIASLLATRP